MPEYVQDTRGGRYQRWNRYRRPYSQESSRTQLQTRVTTSTKIYQIETWTGKRTKLGQFEVWLLSTNCGITCIDFTRWRRYPYPALNIFAFRFFDIILAISFYLLFTTLQQLNGTLFYYVYHHYRKVTNFLENLAKGERKKGEAICTVWWQLLLYSPLGRIGTWLRTNISVLILLLRPLFHSLCFNFKEF